MSKITDPMDAEAAAQKLLEGRMDYVRRAIDARQALEAAQEAAREAERADSAAYQAAVKTGGWSEDELKKVGLTRPEKIKRVQRKRQAKSEPTRSDGQGDAVQGQNMQASNRSEDAGQNETLQPDV